jgi:hypothetical protein
MLTESIVVPESIRSFVKKLTGQSEFSILLLPATKKRVQLRLAETQTLVTSFENKYQMTFPEFEAACCDGRIKDPYSYAVEKDDWEWETAICEHADFEEIWQWLLSVEENIK